MSISENPCAAPEPGSPPLLAGAVHGVRAWSVMVDGDTGRELLAAASRDVVWPRRRPMRAVCTPGGCVDDTCHAPAADCTCGIYAYHPHLASRLQTESLDYEDCRVLGVVEAWGRIEVHDAGFRAEYARPATLLVDSDCWEPFKERMERLASEYGAEYVELDGSDAIAEYCVELEAGLSRAAVGELLAEQADVELHLDAVGYTTRRGRAIGGHGYQLDDQDELSPWDNRISTEVPGAMILRVAGAKYCPEALQGPWCAPGRELRLLAEPTNDHDKNAVAIWDAGLERRIGYVPREHAEEVSERLKAGQIAIVVSLWQWRNLDDGERFGLHILISRSPRVYVADGEDLFVEDVIPF